MASLTSQIRSILNGSKAPATTTGEMKVALGTVYDFITELLGTDSSDKAAARKALGVTGSSGIRNLVHNPDFHFNTRDYVSGAAVSDASSKRYTLDRWRMKTDGASITFAASGNGRIVTVGASPMEQIIEGRNISGGTYCATWEGTASCTVNGAAVAKGATFTLPANTDASLQFVNGTVEKVQLERESVGAWEDVDREVQRRILDAYCRKINIYWQGNAKPTTGPDGSTLYYYYAMGSKMRAAPNFVTVSNIARPPVGNASGVSTGDPVVYPYTDVLEIRLTANYVGSFSMFYITFSILVAADI